MEGRTIPLHGGGELMIGGGPLIDGLIHCWVKKPPPGRGGSFMIGSLEAEELVKLLRNRKEGEVGTFAGQLKVCEGGNDLLILWIYSWGKRAPDFAIRLYDGSIDITADALEELVQEREARRAA